MSALPSMHLSRNRGGVAQKERKRGDCMDGLEIGLHFVQWKEERRCARRARRGFLRRGNECLRLLHNMKQTQIASAPPCPACACLRPGPATPSCSGQLAVDVVSWPASLANPSKRSSFQLTVSSSAAAPHSARRLSGSASIGVAWRRG